MPATGSPPPGGDVNRAGEVHAFTWILEIISITFVVGRMYSRAKLIKNVWWDDWCVCIAQVSRLYEEKKITSVFGADYDSYSIL